MYKLNYKGADSRKGAGLLSFLLKFFIVRLCQGGPPDRFLIEKSIIYAPFDTFVCLSRLRISPKNIDKIISFPYDALRDT